MFFRAKDLVVENETLLTKIEKFYDISKVDLDKHLFLKENAEIVLAENEALKEKINNLRDQHSIDQQEYSKRIRECKREFMNARNQADDLKQVITQLIYVSIIQCSKTKQSFSKIKCGHFFDAK